MGVSTCQGYISDSIVTIVSEVNIIIIHEVSRPQQTVRNHTTDLPPLSQPIPEVEGEWPHISLITLVTADVPSHLLCQNIPHCKVHFCVGRVGAKSRGS